MKPMTRLALAACAPLLMAALWMDRQPSYKPYRAPVLAPPATAVPVTGRDIVSWETGLRNPVTAGEQSLARGKTLFEINCALCHGAAAAKPGPVGQKLTPPPPGLDHELLQNRDDGHIYKAITLGFGRMLSFRGKLTPEERWDLVNYLRTRK